MRIVHVALCMGVVMATAILASVRLAGNQPPPPPTPLISYVALSFAVLALLLSFVVPKVMAAGWVREFASGKQPVPPVTEPGNLAGWLGMYQIYSLIGMALLEGAAFFQLIAYFIEGQPWSLGIGLGLLVVMLTRFPTQSGIERWVTAQREKIEMMNRIRRDLRPSSHFEKKNRSAVLPNSHSRSVSLRKSSRFRIRSMLSA